MGYFQDAHHALTWATEVLRQSRFPQISKFYHEISSDRRHLDTTEIAHVFTPDDPLPTEKSDRLALAYSIYRCVSNLDEQQQKLLKMKYWGDYYDDKVLFRAQKTQETLRQRGMRVRLNYRYSLRQLATMMGKSHNTVSARVGESLRGLERQLQDLDIVVQTPGARQENYKNALSR